MVRKAVKETFSGSDDGPFHGASPADVHTVLTGVMLMKLCGSTVVEVALAFQKTEIEKICNDPSKPLHLRDLTPQAAANFEQEISGSVPSKDTIVTAVGCKRAVGREGRTTQVLREVMLTHVMFVSFTRNRFQRS